MHIATTYQRGLTFDKWVPHFYVRSIINSSGEIWKGEQSCLISFKLGGREEGGGLPVWGSGCWREQY